jgi:hypothetical protein
MDPGLEVLRETEETEVLKKSGNKSEPTLNHPVLFYETHQLF